jgi:undecaprenyl-diphosphatase
MSRRATALYAFLIALFGVFCYFAHRFGYFPGDSDITLWVQKINFAGIEPFMQFAPYALILVIVAALKFWLPSRRRGAIFIALTGLAAALLSWLLKLLVARPRPDIEPWLAAPVVVGSDFPSMHTACVTVVCGFLFYLAPRLVKPKAVRVLLRALLIALIVFTGVSRIYLGAHWASSVVGGIALGGLLLYPAIVLYNRYRTE